MLSVTVLSEYNRIIQVLYSISSESDFVVDLVLNSGATAYIIIQKATIKWYLEKIKDDQFKYPLVKNIFQ